MMQYLWDEAITAWLAEHKEQMVQDLQQLVHVSSLKGEPQPGAPFGPEPLAALREMQAICSKYGIETVNHDGYCLEAIYGEGPVSIALIGHLDMVPVGDGWTMDPLCGDYKDDKVYGRGSSDNKCSCIGSLYLMRAFRELGISLNGQLRVIFGCDEETGMKDMEYYRAHVGTPDYCIIPDAGFPVAYAEKGILRGVLRAPIDGATRLIAFRGGERPNIIPGTASAVIRAGESGTVSMTAKGVPAHSASPDEGVSAVSLLLDTLKNVLGPEDAAYSVVRFLSEKIGLERDGKSLGIACEDEDTGILTFNMGVLELKDNAFYLTYDIRHPATLDYEPTIQKLLQVLGQVGFEPVEIDNDPSHFMGKDHPLITTLNTVFNELTGAQAEPVTMGGGTYARKFPCAAAFGPASGFGAHSSDEYADIPQLINGLRIIANAVLAVDQLK